MYGPHDALGRHFFTTLYIRTLSNMEKCDREWLVYSKELDKIFCFCCKVFKTGAMRGALPNEGYVDWHHVTTSLQK